jgi:hypothetical protein
VDSTICKEYIHFQDFPIIQINQDSIIMTNGFGSLTYQWFFNGNLIPDATDEFYIPAQSGNYSVLAMNSLGCESESAPLNFVVTNTSNITLSQPINIFPNPANVILNVKSASPIESGKIYNAQGQIIQLIQGNRSQIDIANLEGGIYFLEIEVNKARQVLKFFKL